VGFQAFALPLGLYGYHLPDMDLVAEVADGYYSTISAAARATWRSAS
jgi:hypothetical protein